MLNYFKAITGTLAEHSLVEITFPFDDTDPEAMRELVARGVDGIITDVLGAENQKLACLFVAKGIHEVRRERPTLGIVLITHYQRLLDFIVPDYVHILYKGRIVHSGDKNLALELEQKGYDWIRERVDA